MLDFGWIRTSAFWGMGLLPGLIDAHFHLDNLNSLPTVFLSRGITSVRDPGAWIEAYAQERASGRSLPRLYLTRPTWVRYSDYGWAYHHEMELLKKLGSKRFVQNG